MGNCAASRRHAGASWADGDEWEVDEEAAAAAASWEDHHGRREHATSEVTIRITKRQLHEMMERGAATGGGGHGRNSRGSAQQLLSEIMNSGQVHHHEQHREAHWKPALQSIPETVESCSSSMHTVNRSSSLQLGGSVAA